MQRILGVLGGMGPLATVDFMEKLVTATPADRDQDHVAVIAASLPQIPDRSDAITGDGPSPLAAMVGTLGRLERAGAQAIAIACNTAHHWHADIQRHTALPVLHIADAAIGEMTSAGAGHGTRVGVLATTGTLEAGIFRHRLADAGMDCVDLTAGDQQSLVMAGIRAVKGGDMDTGAALLAAAADALRARGAERIIMACTEVPPAMAHAGAHAGRQGPGYVDATAALARACVAWARVNEDAVEQIAA